MNEESARFLPEWARRGQAAWQWDGTKRPTFAVKPEIGQESVWDYPRPPILVPDARTVLVRADETVLAHTQGALRLLETASPPTFYLPQEDVDMSRLVVAGDSSRCEWKGEANDYHVTLPTRQVEHAAWCYPDPFGQYVALAGYVSFYPARLECFVDGERVQPQPGGFYGGWVTKDVCGPFKGEQGTGGW